MSIVMLSFILKYISLQSLIWAIVGLPLLASVINFSLAILSSRFKVKGLGPVSSVVGTLFPVMAFLSAVVILWVVTGFQGEDPTAITGALYKWISFGGWNIEVGLKIDQLSMVMSLVVTGVGSLIHIYSIGYMHGDEGYPRYFAELNLFLFFMLLLVLADNMLVMFIGWEGVGLCSYFLISFWFSDSEKAKAGKKAFVVNRIGDFGFLIGLFFIWNTLSYQEMVGPGVFNFEVLQRNAAFLLPLATPICLALFIGACGKSAQIPLYIWLPDAMAGPTPVSALIHAATMVTAGVYMVARLNFLFILSPYALSVVAFIGAATALFAATIGLTQRDIKKVLAYSTISQLGLMFMAEGVGSFSPAIFHLVTHSFFKAALFLAAGSVIHALHGEQDMFKMGGLKKYLPGTSSVFFVASLAIAGIWPFAGFFSKDEILWELYDKGHFGLWLVGFITAGFTAFYIFRAVALTFWGRPNMGEEKGRRIQESSFSMLAPMVLLAFLSFVGGWMNGAFSEFLTPLFASKVAESLEPHKSAEHVMAIISTVWAAHWAFVAWVIYSQRPNWPAALADKFKGIYKLLMNKYYIDELYGFVFIKPLKWFFDRALWQGLDGSVIDDVCVNGSARSVGLMGRLARLTQTGLTPHYMLFMVLGLVFVIVLIVL